MASILLVTSSPREDSLSTRIARELADTLQADNPGKPLVHRDLAADGPKHLDRVLAAAVKAPADALTPEEAEAIKSSNELTAELLDADTLIIATGLINFGVYSTLKSWIDNVARAGLTFRYTENGPVGLAPAKKAYVVLASGGVYSHGPAAAMNHAAPYLKTVLGFMGVSDVEVIPVEGAAMGPDGAARALDAARGRIGALAEAA